MYARNRNLSGFGKDYKFYQGAETYLCSRTSMAYYNLWVEEGWDDRPRLDEKFPKPVSLFPVNINWKLTTLGIILFLLGIVTGKRLKKN